MSGRARLLTATLAGCLLVAGCHGFAGPTADGGSGTLTPAPVPTDTGEPETVTTSDAATHSPSPDRGSLPPGVTRSGIDNVSRLARAHRRAVAGRSYVRVSRLAVTASPGGTALSVRHRNRTVATSTDVFRHDSTVVRERPGTGAVTRVNRSLYVDGLRAIERTATETGTRYDRVSLAYRARVLDGPSRKIERYLVAAPATVATVERNGSRYVLVVIRSGAQVPGTRDYAATLLVTPDGFVRSLRVHFRASGDPNLSRVTYRLRYERIGTASVRSATVGRPAVNATGGESPG